MESISMYEEFLRNFYYQKIALRFSKQINANRAIEVINNRIGLSKS